MNFTTSISSENVERALENFQASLADNSPALARIADDLREMITEQFASEGRAGGTPWAELAPSSRRGDRGPRAGILYSTGALLGSLRDPGAAGHLEELDNQSLLFGSRLPYALFHQTGTGVGFGQSELPVRARKDRNLPGPGRGRALPMRPLIVMTDGRAERWIEIVRAQIEEKSLLLGAQELAA